MKKYIEFCIRCNDETMHRSKRRSFKRTGKSKGRASFQMPEKCMTCGYEATARPKKEGKKKKTISLREDN